MIYEIKESGNRTGKWNSQKNGNWTVWSRRSGFSLIEIVMALGIFSFCMIGMLGLLPVALQSIGTTINTDTRARMLQATRTELLNAPFTGLPALSGMQYSFDADGMALGSNVQQARFQITVTITGTTSIPGGNLNSVYSAQLSGLDVITHQTFTNQIHLPDNGF